jgi:hypothetical protein
MARHVNAVINQDIAYGCTGKYIILVSNNDDFYLKAKSVFLKVSCVGVTWICYSMPEKQSCHFMGSIMTGGSEAIAFGAKPSLSTIIALAPCMHDRPSDKLVRHR